MDRAGPFHEGELRVQAATGEAEAADHNGGMVGDHLVAGARKFLEQQALLGLASVDAEGNVWASVLEGEPGFARAPDAERVVIDLTSVARDGQDPLWANAQVGSDVGILAIHPATRARYRVNGTVSARSEGSLELRVREAFGNCPKYITRRLYRTTGTMASGGDAAFGATLGAEQLELIERADTFFIASRHPARGVDVSHRGGPAGFVRPLDARTLRIPDYPGNSLFNTLGNLAVHPRAGLVFPDFGGGRVLQLTGRTVLRLDQPDSDGASRGTGRFWDFAVDRFIDSPSPSRRRWELSAAPAHRG
jgi:uncharacterized protein